ncbi:MAG: hypothetical protein HQL51_14510 [Magnetococcales bacterium]|nr:hypothetical protein [Magnetococcales bacterium]
MKLLNMFGSKGKSAGSAVEGGATSEGKHLLLYLGPEGWECRWIQEDGSHQVAGHWNGLMLEEEGTERMEKVFQSAATELVKTAFSNSGRVSILWSEPEITYSDSKPTGLASANAPAARRIGQQMVGAKDVTFAHEQHPVPGDPHAKWDLYAFADAARLRNLLSLFEAGGLKVIEITPSLYPLMHRSLKKGGEVYGALVIGALESTLLLVNPGLGAVLTRRLPVGVSTLAQAVAKRNAISLEESFQSLGKRNLLENLKPLDKGGDAGSTLAVSPHQLALAPLVSRLLTGIQETLQFFEIQKASSRPQVLEVFGAGDKINGLIPWLATHLHFPLETVKESMLDLYTGLEHPMAPNLLRGAESSLLMVGRTRFYFSESAGFVRTKDNAPEPTKSAAPAKRTQTTQRRRRGADDRQPSATQSLAKLFEKLKNLGGGKKNLEEDAGEESEVRGKDRMYFAAFGFFVFIALYGAYDELAKLEKKHRGLASNYFAERDKLRQLQKSPGGRAAGGLQVGSDVDKVLWSEKFMALAELMNENIWITDIHLTREQRGVEGAKVESKKMVIEGAVLPSTEGHVQKVSLYVDKLLQDKDRFMSDFRTITFGGVEVDDSETDQIVRFSLHAWYDQNKRLEHPGATPDGSPPGLQDMNRNIDQRNEALQQLTPAAK